MFAWGGCGQIQCITEDVCGPRRLLQPQKKDCFHFLQHKPLKNAFKGFLSDTLAVRDYPPTAAADKLTTLTSVNSTLTVIWFHCAHVSMQLLQHDGVLCASYDTGLMTPFKVSLNQPLVSSRVNISSCLGTTVCVSGHGSEVIISGLRVLCLFIPSVLRNTGGERISSSLSDSNGCNCTAVGCTC